MKILPYNATTTYTRGDLVEFDDEVHVCLYFGTYGGTPTMNESWATLPEVLRAFLATHKTFADLWR